MSHKKISFQELLAKVYDTNSPQFKLSDKLIDLRVGHGIPIEEVEEITGLTLDDYIQLEYAEMNIPVQTYEKVIQQFQEYIDNKGG